MKQHFMIIAAPVCGRVSNNVTTDTEAVDCGNCKRSQAFKDAAKSGAEILADLLSLDNGTTPATIETIPTARETTPATIGDRVTGSINGQTYVGVVKSAGIRGGQTDSLIVETDSTLTTPAGRLVNRVVVRGDEVAELSTIPSARSRYADAGFFTGYTGSNRQTFQNFRITAIFPDGSSEVTATGHNGTLKLASLTDFLMWITPQGMHIGRILDAVIGDGMTWVQAMDLEYALTAECESVDAIEYAVNDALMSRIRNLAVGSRVMVSGEMATVVQVRGTEAMVKLDTPDSRDGSHIVIPAEDTLIERIKATTDRIHAAYLRDLRNLVSRPVRTNLARRARKAARGLR